MTPYKTRDFKIWRMINAKFSSKHDDGFKRMKLHQATSITPSINRHPFNLRNMVNMHLGTACVLSGDIDVGEKWMLVTEFRCW